MKLGLYPPLATGNCESCWHVKEKRDHILGGGKHCIITATGGQAKELCGQLPPSLYLKRGPDEDTAKKRTKCFHLRFLSMKQRRICQH